MDKTYDVAVIVGSLRKDSVNRKVANALAELAPAELKLSIVEIGQLPLYNQDGDENPPPEWTAFRERIKAADAVLFVTPEHNARCLDRMTVWRETGAASTFELASLSLFKVAPRHFVGRHRRRHPVPPSRSEALGFLFAWRK